MYSPHRYHPSSLEDAIRDRIESGASKESTELLLKESLDFACAKMGGSSSIRQVCDERLSDLKKKIITGEL